MLQATKIMKRFGNKQILHSIDLTVKKGEIFGFLGRNGAGKSTFTNILTGILQPTSGQVRYFNEGALTTNLKKRVGVLPDYTSFYDHLTALQHLQYFAEISGFKVSKANCVAQLSKVGLQDAVHVKVGKFSFGMKKKLGIAQAVIHNPEFVFLDEPTSGIDAESAIHLQNYMQELKANGKTIFLTSHNLNEVEKLCDRIAILKDGQIVQCGTMEELRARYTTENYVRIKYKGRSQGIKEHIVAGCTQFAELVDEKEDWLSFHVQQEQDIAHLLRVFHELKTDVYRVEVNETSLEDIFIGDERHA